MRTQEKPNGKEMKSISREKTTNRKG